MKKICLMMSALAGLLQICAAESVPQWCVCWGYGSSVTNYYSRSTNVLMTPRNTMANVETLAVNYGWSGVAILRDSKEVMAWGWTDGITSLPPGLKNPVAFANGGGHYLALNDDGSVVVWGDKRFTRVSVPKEATNIVYIAVGQGSAAAIRRDGKLFGWGDCRIPADMDNVIAVAMSKTLHGQNLALKPDGTVLAWSNQSRKPIEQVSGLSNVVQIATSPVHNLALKKDGTVVAWGNESYPETCVPAGLSDVKSIAVGGNGGLGLRSDGYSLALKNDGTVVAWGSMGTDKQPVFVPAGLSNIVEIAADGNCCVALTTNRLVAEKFLNKNGM